MPRACTAPSTRGLNPGCKPALEDESCCSGLWVSLDITCGVLRRRPVDPSARAPALSREGELAFGVTSSTYIINPRFLLLYNANQCVKRATGTSYKHTELTTHQCKHFGNQTLNISFFLFFFFEVLSFFSKQLRCSGNCADRRSWITLIKKITIKPIGKLLGRPNSTCRFVDLIESLKKIKSIMLCSKKISLVVSKFGPLKVRKLCWASLKRALLNAPAR